MCKCFCWLPPNIHTGPPALPLIRIDCRRDKSANMSVLRQASAHHHQEFKDSPLDVIVVLSQCQKEYLHIISVAKFWQLKQSGSLWHVHVKHMHLYNHMAFSCLKRSLSTFVYTVSLSAVCTGQLVSHGYCICGAIKKKSGTSSPCPNLTNTPSFIKIASRAIKKIWFAVYSLWLKHSVDSSALWFKVKLFYLLLARSTLAHVTLLVLCVHFKIFLVSYWASYHISPQVSSYFACDKKWFTPPPYILLCKTAFKASLTLWLYSAYDGLVCLLVIT